MSDSDVFSAAAVPAAFPELSAPLAKALARRGFTALTSVQSAVLREDLKGRDLRISSRTGSGKTVALGLAVAELVGAHERALTASLCAHPSVLLVAPTRELAAQIGKELTWLFSELGSVCVVTGGTSTSQERRELSRGPAVVVGTPGRLCDHLERGALELSKTRAVVLDEADQMFDLGFREALETLLNSVSEECRKHLVSATFPRAVLALAQRFQKNAALVSGDSVESAHTDITQIAYLIHPSERYAALVNVLLLDPELRTLVFVRTRADASEVASRLVDDGFRAGALSGDLAQAERTRMLEAFRKGTLAILVCTDVASRGIDVPEVARVVHAELPDNAEVLTHRSGRTGRAGRKGVSIMLVAANQYRFAENMLRGANVRAELLPAPAPREVLERRDERLLEQLAENPERPASDLARRVIEALGPEAAVEALLVRVLASGSCAPRPVTALSPERPANKPAPRTFRGAPAPRQARGAHPAEGQRRAPYKSGARHPKQAHRR
ncbi:MAG TPA: DEAD/DEAH box helicase [Polyangiales bacterium]